MFYFIGFRLEGAFCHDVGCGQDQRGKVKSELIRKRRQETAKQGFVMCLLFGRYIERESHATGPKKIYFSLQKSRTKIII